MVSTNRGRLAAAVALAFILVLAGACSTGGKKETGAIETGKIAEEAFIYGYPMVMNYGAMYEMFIDKSSSQYKAPMNEIYNDSKVFTPADTAVVTPNSDTPYSMLVLDLRAEPMVICVPAVEKSRYYSVQLVDMYTFNYGYIGSRATGSAAGCYTVAGPNWKGETPAGTNKLFRAGSDFSIVIFRTQLFNAADMVNVKKIQAGYKAQPLSQFLKQPAPPAAPAVDWPKFSKEESKTNFFAYLNFVMQFCPEVPEEKELRARFAQIGIGAGKPFDLAKLGLEEKTATELGMKAGLDKITKQKASGGKLINGWHVGSLFGDRAFFHGDWLMRAAAAMAGIYGNDAVEAMYPMSTEDKTGAALDGHTHAYTLTFPAGQLPPVNAFWSVTMYDGKTQLLIKNPIDRYLINSPMLPGMKKNPDGSLTLYIQKDSPGKAKESNWLPAPDGPIYLVMRLYWPKEKPPSILPPGEGTWNPPGVEVAK
jgi:hypothetical protein